MRPVIPPVSHRGHRCVEFAGKSYAVEPHAFYNKLCTKKATAAAYISWPVTYNSVRLGITGPQFSSERQVAPFYSQ